MKNPRILIVEDDLLSSTLLKTYLTQLGYGLPWVARSGKEALHLSMRHKPDLVLMDILLEGDMDGIDAAKSINDYAAIPIIYMTSNEDDETFQRAKITGPFGYLVKPVEPGQLRTHIEMALYNAWMAERLRESEERYRRLVETMNEGVGMVDENGCFSYANDRLCDMIGYTPDDLNGCHFETFFCDDHLKTARQHWRQRRDGRAATYEIEAMTRSGEPLFVLISSTPLFDKTGRFQGASLVVTDITDRKTMETALRKSELRYRTLFNDSPLSLWKLNFSDVLDHLEAWFADEKKDWPQLFQNRPDILRQCMRRLHLVAANHITPSVFGVETQEAFWTFISEALSGEWAGMFIEVLTVLAEGKTQTETRDQAMTIGEEIRFFDFKWAVLPGYEDRLDKVLVTVVDTTDRTRAEQVLRHSREELEHTVATRTAELRKTNQQLQTEFKDRLQAEKALRESEAKLRHIYDHSPVMMHSIDETGRFCNVNENWLQTTGYAREEIIGQKADFIMAPESAQRAFSEVIPRFWRKGHIRNVPYRYVRKDGSEMEVLLDCDAARDPTGNRISLSVVRDVTEQNRIQRGIWEAKRSLRTVVDGISDPLILMDQHLIVHMLNEAALNYYGLDQYAEAIGNPCYIGLKKHAQVCHRCAIAKIVKLGSDLTFTRKGLLDPERTEQVSVYRVTNVAEGVGGAIIRITDITEQRKIDEQLIRADRLSSLGQLSAGIAHEIRNPLSGISLFVDILSDPEKYQHPPEELEVLSEIKTNILKINAIVKRVLDFARHSDPTAERVDLNALIQDILLLWHARMRKQNIHPVFNPSEGLSAIEGDPVGIQQVMNNFIQNAIEAMPEGGELSIATSFGKSIFWGDRSVAVVRVSDTGDGIPASIQDQIFNPFFTTKRKGTGLGLSISYQIIERHGGIISIEKSNPHGTTFQVELPMEH